jgi:hypothetical protein
MDTNCSNVNQLKDTICDKDNEINNLKETILAFCHIIDNIVQTEGIDDLGQLAIGTEQTEQLLDIKTKAYNSIFPNSIKE